MAEAEDDTGEKDQAPTGKRLAELSKHGNVMRSKDMSSGMLIIAGLAMVSFMGSQFKNRIELNFLMSFNGIGKILDSNLNVEKFLAHLAMENLKLLLPIFFILIIVAIFSPRMFGGWNFTMYPMMFNLAKLNPIANIGKIFKLKNMLPELLKSMLKSTIILGCLIYFIVHNKDYIVSLIYYDSKSAIIACYSIVTNFIVSLAYVIIIIVAIDMLYTYYTYTKQNKMSLTEIRDESKSSEGSPVAKNRIRSDMVKLFKQRLAQTVPKANVVIVNPTHYAVAIRYEEKKYRAPKVVAKGKDLIAQQIRTIAISNGIPLYQAPQLARAIYFTTKINREIHPDLYMAVAIVLSYVHQLKSYQMGIGQPPNFVTDLQIPKEFIYDE